MQYLSWPTGKDMKLSSLQKIKLGLFGKVMLGYSEPSKGEDQVVYYAFKCPVHGVQMDYPHGHDDTLKCPECVKQHATGLKTLKRGILTNLNKTIDRRKNEKTEKTLKEKGFINKHKTVLSVSAIGFICMLMGYKIIKDRKK